MGFEVWDDDLLAAADQALTRPSSFGYWGDLPLFESWGLTFDQTRDSDLVGRSNFRSLLRDAQVVATAEDGDNAEDAAEYVQVEHMNHWLNGWIDHAVVRVLIDPDKGVEVDNLTATFKFVVGACLFIRDESPIYDESDWSELETEECEAAFDTEWNGIDWSELVPNGDWDDEIKWCVYRQLTENETPDGFDADEIRDLYIQAVEWQAWQDYARTYSGQLWLFGTPPQFNGCRVCGNRFQH